MEEMAGRPRLSWGQRILIVALGVLIAAVQAMIVQAYHNLSGTIRSLDTATEVLTDLHDAHRETFRLALTVDRFQLPDGLDEMELRRGLLDRQLEATFGASDDPGCGRISPGSGASSPRSTPTSPGCGRARPPRGSTRPGQGCSGARRRSRRC